MPILWLVRQIRWFPYIAPSVVEWLQATLSMPLNDRGISDYCRVHNVVLLTVYMICIDYVCLMVVMYVVCIICSFGVQIFFCNKIILSYLIYIMVYYKVCKIYYTKIKKRVKDKDKVCIGY